MGASLCGFQNRASPGRSSNQGSGIGIKNRGLTTPVMKFMKPRCLWDAMKIEKKQLQVQEDDHELHLYKNKCKVLTLEDLIISSPGFNVNGSDLQVQKMSSRKIHPSFDSDLKEEFLPKFTDSFYVEIEMKTEEAEIGRLENTKSGKLKKKVSFRSPVVADVY